MKGDESIMADRNRAFRTGEPVVEPCNYVCEVGERTAYREGEAFKACRGKWKRNYLESGRRIMWLLLVFQGSNHQCKNLA